MKVIVNVQTLGTPDRTTSVNVEKISSHPNPHSKIINDTINIGDKVFVPLNYGHKLGYYLGKSASDNFQYIEINWRTFGTGNSKNTPIRGDFYLKEELLHVDNSIKLQMFDYIAAFNRGERSFTFNISVNQ